MIYGEAPFRLISMRRGYRPDDPLADGLEELGGKAHGLLTIQQAIADLSVDEIVVSIPRMTVLGTSVFDAFMQRNRLWDVALSDLPDERIAYAFLRGDLPFEALGELRALIQEWKTPLAVRSSGQMEDTTHRPFAGVYKTKMIPNNSHDPDVRFQKLVEAIKYVWASTFFHIAKDYCRATGLCLGDEKMAVIIQEIVGKRYHDRFYPELSGVARSFNFYPVPPARPEDGVVSLALGLGKTIVDGGKAWIYSPAFPQAPPPFKSIQDMLEETQNEFWVVHMGEPPEYNPVKETEFMRLENLMTAERDGALKYLASTYEMESGRLSMGIGARGPRVLTFAPLLVLNEIPFNPVIRGLLDRCEQALDGPVEIEFAMTFDPHRLGFLQVRPMMIPTGEMDISLEEMRQPSVFLASETVLGNGMSREIEDVVYVVPERFELQNTRQVAHELEKLNRQLLDEKRPYVLIVFGRLGTLDPWLGIPVTWGQICGARVIVEATLENVRVELSQGSHYFHNIINLGILYFCMPYSGAYRVDWNWLKSQPACYEGEFVRHVRLPAPLDVRVNGRSRRGVIYKP